MTDTVQRKSRFNAVALMLGALLIVPTTGAVIAYIAVLPSLLVP